MRSRVRQRRFGQQPVTISSFHASEKLETRVLLTAPQNLQLVQELPFAASLQLSINDAEFPVTAVVSVEDGYTGKEISSTLIYFPAGEGDRLATLPLPISMLPGHRKIVLRVSDKNPFFNNLNGNYATLNVDVKYAPLIATISGTDTTINWPAHPGATGYDIWINDVTRNVSQFVRDQNLTITSFTGTFTEGTFTAWVRARLADDSVTQWSEPTSFTISGPIRMMTPTGTLRDGKGNETFTWSKYKDATGYELWVTNNDTNTRIIHEQNLPATDTAYYASFDLVPASYSAWVRPRFAGNVFGAWSPVSKFQIRPRFDLPDRPDISFSGNATTISWPAVSGAATYDLWINDVTNSVRQFVRELALATNSYNGTFASGTFTAWFRPKSAAGVYLGEWSQPASFAVSGPLSVQQPISDFTEKTGDGALTWTAFKDAIGYELWVNNNTTGTRVIYETSLSRDVAAYYPATPLVPASYAVWVRARLAGGTFSAWSVARRCTVQPGEIRVIGGANKLYETSFDNTPTLTWDAARITSPVYDLSIFPGSDSGGAVYSRVGLTGTSHTLETPLAAGLYNIRVIARNTLGQQTPSQNLPVFLRVGFEFSQIPGIRYDGNRTLSFIGSGSAIGGARGATYFDLQIDEEGGSTVYRNQQIPTTSFQLPESLTNVFQFYRAWVRAVRVESNVTYYGTWSLTSYRFRLLGYVPKDSSNAPEGLLPSDLVHKVLPVSRMTVQAKQTTPDQRQYTDADDRVNQGMETPPDLTALEAQVEQPEANDTRNLIVEVSVSHNSEFMIDQHLLAML